MLKLVNMFKTTRKLEKSIVKFGAGVIETHGSIGIFFLALLCVLGDVGFTAAKEISPLSITVIDGEKVAYQGHPKIANYLVLKKTLPDIFGDFSVDFSYHDVQSKKASGAWVNPSDIVNEKPDLILVHWSSFRYAENIKYCHPSISGVSLQCAEDIIHLLLEVFDLMKNSPKFIIYSRNPAICETGFKNELYKLVRKNAKLADAIGLISMSELARGRSFYNPIAQRDIRSLSLKLLGYSNSFKANNKQGRCLLRTP